MRWKLFDKCSTSAQTVIHAHYVTVKGAVFFPKANIYGLQRIYSNRPYISGLMIIFWRMCFFALQCTMQWGWRRTSCLTMWTLTSGSRISFLGSCKSTTTGTHTLSLLNYWNDDLVSYCLAFYIFTCIIFHFFKTRLQKCRSAPSSYRLANTWSGARVAIPQNKKFMQQSWKFSASLRNPCGRTIDWP